MADDRSSIDYVKNKFYDDIYPAVEDFVERNWEGLDLRRSNVHDVEPRAITMWNTMASTIRYLMSCASS